MLGQRRIENISAFLLTLLIAYCYIFGCVRVVVVFSEIGADHSVLRSSTTHLSSLAMRELYHDNMLKGQFNLLK